VRFNAEKKKIGNYYSTPIYSFRMKHIPCGGWIEIRTDPQNTAYVVHEGARKRDTGEDKPLEPGEIAIWGPGLGQDPAEKDPFAKIEGKIEDKRKADTEASRIRELQERQDRDWDDPYEQSKRLRRTFREERKGLEKLETNCEALKNKMSLGIDLADETEEDRQRAGMVDFGYDQSAAGIEAARANRRRPMFEQLVSKNTAEERREREKNKGSARRTKAAELARRKASLHQELAGNTRAAIDPFLKDASDDPKSWKSAPRRKSKPASLRSAHRGETEISDTTDTSNKNTPISMPETLPKSPGKRLPTGPPRALVDYGSDSD
jgi:coiled-coil domain-containing protein 130